MFYAVGGLATEHHVGLIYTLALTAGVFAAPLQIVLLTHLQHAQALLETVLIATVIINCRFMLMSATLAPFVRRMSKWQQYLLLPMLSASTFAVMHANADTKTSSWTPYAFGVCITAYSVAILATALGFESSQLIMSPLFNDLIRMVLPCHFVILMAKKWPQIAPLAVTLISFILMPLAQPVLGQYTLLILPLSIGLITLVVSKVRSAV